MEPPLINPFTDADLDTVEITALLKEFARELETPLRRSDDLSTYLPSQSLTRSIRLAGFDGIRYPSAMNSGGSNIVLFDTTAAKFEDSYLVEIVIWPIPDAWVNAGHHSIRSNFSDGHGRCWRKMAAERRTSKSLLDLTKCRPIVSTA